MRKDNDLIRESAGGNVFTETFNWFDYVEVTVYEKHSFVPNHRQVKEHTFTKTKKRTNTWFTSKTYANLKLHEYDLGGFVLTSSSPGNVDNTNGSGKPGSTLNVDGLAAAVPGMAKLSAQGLEFASLGKWNEFLEKFNEALNSASEGIRAKFMESGKFDLEDPNQKALFEKMQGILNQYGAQPENPQTQTSAPPAATSSGNSQASKKGIFAGKKKGTIVNLKGTVANSKVINDSTGEASNKPATDTVPYNN